MRYLRYNCLLFLYLCSLSFFFLPLVEEAQANTKLAAEFVPKSQSKRKVVEQLSTGVMKQTTQTRQIIEIEEDKSISRDSVERRETENEKIESENNFKSKREELLVAGIINSIREKLTKCWSIPESVAHKENFSVKINLLLSNQGEIIIANVADISSYKNNPIFRSLADSAMRAAYKCSPITSLPVKYYHIWREITLDFIL